MVVLRSGRELTSGTSSSILFKRLRLKRVLTTVSSCSSIGSKCLRSKDKDEHKFVMNMAQMRERANMFGLSIDVKTKEPYSSKYAIDALKFYNEEAGTNYELVDPGFITTVLLKTCFLHHTDFTARKTDVADAPEEMFFAELTTTCGVRCVKGDKVESDFLDRILNSKGNSAYTSVLFYAAWCPFSHNVRSTFKILSAMFPHIEHLEVEESSVVPRVHSFPTILMVKQTSTLRYLGPKDLNTVVSFYKRSAGWEPIQYVDMEEAISSEGSGEFVMRSWVGSSPYEILRREPSLLGTLIAVSSLYNINKCTTEGFITLQISVGSVWTTFELGNIWRDQPNIGASPSDDQFKDDLDQTETM